MLLIRTHFLHNGRRCSFQNSCHQLSRIGLCPGGAINHTGKFRFIHFQRDIQLQPRLQPCDQRTQTIDLVLTIGNIFVSENRFIRIHFRFRLCGIQKCGKFAAPHFLSGNEQRFFCCIILPDRLKRSADTDNIRLQTRNIGTVTGSENVGHPVFIADYAFLRVDLYNAQMHQFMNERISAAVQTNDSKLPHLNNCHTFPRPFRSPPERLPLSFPLPAL